MNDDTAAYAGAAGFYGKVTSHGDFVTRRLPGAFKDPWDHWLQQGMQGSRQQLGQSWLATYLSSPIWRFALAPGVCGPTAWAGVLMPSVDRVGRHFPLTIAASVSAQASLIDCMETGSPWYGQLEAAALSSLRDDFSLEAFDAALIAFPALVPAPATAPDGSSGICIPIAGVDALHEAMPALLRHIANATVAGHSLWWTEGSAEVAPCLLLCQGLPAEKPFTGMLDGAWQDGQWKTVVA